MKHPVFVLFPALVLLAASPVVLAGPQGLPDAVRSRLASVDANHDGVIDRGEARSLQRLDAQFEQLDRNSDGRLTQQEIDQALQSRWAAADANHDGYIDKGEAQQASMPRLQRGFDRLDTDRDGRLSQTELQAVVQAFQAPVAGHAR